MTIFDSIAARRAIFPAAYTGEALERVQIEQLIEAANYAPTHRFTEPWRFVAFEQKQLPELGQALLAAYKQSCEAQGQEPSLLKEKKIAKNIEKSGAVLAIVMQRDAQERVPEWEELAALAMAVQNMWLATSALGLGGYWSSPGFATKSEQFAHFLELGEGQSCFGLFYLGGYQAQEEQQAQRGPWQEKLRWFGE